MCSTVGAGSGITSDVQIKSEIWVRSSWNEAIIWSIGGSKALLASRLNWLSSSSKVSGDRFRFSESGSTSCSCDSTNEFMSVTFSLFSSKIEELDSNWSTNCEDSWHTISVWVLNCSE